MDAPLPISYPATIAPDDIRHALDEGWSTFRCGWRLDIRRDDLARIAYARRVAQALVAEAAMWDRDLEAVEADLIAQIAAEHAKAAEPADEPYGGDDPALDAQVEKVATLPETRRKTRTPKDEK